MTLNTPTESMEGHLPGNYTTHYNVKIFKGSRFNISEGPKIILKLS